MFITDYIKQWKERRRRKSILEDIKNAKGFYLRRECDFMCNCFFHVDSNKYWHIYKVQAIIPEFNREFLKAKNPFPCGAWWDKKDRKSRIEAFDKLIEVYSKR